MCGQSPTRNLQAPASRVIAIRYAPEPVSIPHSVDPALMPSLHSFVSPPPPFTTFFSHSSSAPTQKRPSPRPHTSTVQIAIIGIAEPVLVSSALASASARLVSPIHCPFPSASPSPQSLPRRMFDCHRHDPFANTHASADVPMWGSTHHHISVSHLTYVIETKYPM